MDRRTEMGLGMQSSIFFSRIDNMPSRLGPYPHYFKPFQIETHGSRQNTQSAFEAGIVLAAWPLRNCHSELLRWRPRGLAREVSRAGWIRGRTRSLSMPRAFATPVNCRAKLNFPDL
jgi:hypothetical protein